MGSPQTAFNQGKRMGIELGKTYTRKEIRNVIERNKSLIDRCKEEIDPESDSHIAYSKGEIEKLLTLIDYISKL